MYSVELCSVPYTIYHVPYTLPYIPYIPSECMWGSRKNCALCTEKHSSGHTAGQLNSSIFIKERIRIRSARLALKLPHHAAMRFHLTTDIACKTGKRVVRLCQDSICHTSSSSTGSKGVPACPIYINIIVKRQTGNGEGETGRGKQRQLKCCGILIVAVNGFCGVGNVY